MIALTPLFAVAPQIDASDIPAIAAQGVKTIVCNRPDGEEWGQPSGAELRAAAVAAGLDYVDIPVGPAGFSAEQITALRQVLDRGEPVLAFCRSGTRSTFLWALTSAARGEDPAALAQAAAAAGYSLAPIAGLMASLRP